MLLRQMGHRQMQLLMIRRKKIVNHLKRRRKKRAWQNSTLFLKIGPKFSSITLLNSFLLKKLLNSTKIKLFWNNKKDPLILWWKIITGLSIFLRKTLFTWSLLTIKFTYLDLEETLLQKPSEYSIAHKLPPVTKTSNFLYFQSGKNGWRSSTSWEIQRRILS